MSEANPRPYLTFYKDKRHNLVAASIYDAQRTAATFFKAKKPWDVTVVLADVPVNTGSIG